MKHAIAVASLFAVSALASLSAAESLPKGTGTSAPVTTGQTNVTAEGQFAAVAKPEEKKEDKDEKELVIGAGGLTSTGNSPLVSLTANAKGRYRFSDNQFSAGLAANYGWSKPAGEPGKTTVENYQARVRYDRFFSKELTGFLGFQGRSDRFAGLDLRFQVDPGVGYYFSTTPDLLLWAEAGYDLLYDIRRDDARPKLDGAGKPVLDANQQPVLLDKTNTVHSARLFLGLRKEIRSGVKFDVNVEYLQSLTDIETLRLNADTAINVALSKRFSLALSFLFRFDNKPLPGKQNIDTITSAALTYAMF